MVYLPRLFHAGVHTSYFDSCSVDRCGMFCSRSLRVRVVWATISAVVLSLWYGSYWDDISTCGTIVPCISVKSMERIFYFCSI